ncbi:MAG TPA: twin-arginine translocase TatA/TatE family subunit [Bacteroidales bacterium]|nr:twin-arginine translocase TatA/TatE family subunit [Bacteroidales bacterium]
MTSFLQPILLFGISGGEVLIILLLALLLFGPSKIPEIARMIGKGVNEVKKVQQEINSEINRYSGEIEKEARKMQQGIDDLHRDLKNPGSDRLGLIDEPDDLHENGKEEKTISNDSSGKDLDEELPYHYRQKIDEEEESATDSRPMN